MKHARPTTLPELARHLKERATQGRILIALAGPPGAGKSTCAEQLAALLNGAGAAVAAVLPMDGYHLDDMILNAQGLRARKGAPSTFDVAGLGHMLQRLRLNEENEIAVPVFDRTLEIARAGARLISRDVKVLIVEGNYLLLNTPPWSALAQYFDLTVSVCAPEAQLQQRLIDRWQAAGIASSQVQAKVELNDLPNGRTVLAHSALADFVLETGPASRA
ncbi:nucleoside/nucleotide kinase family protein [Pseudomonas abieticivorans]|uniref:nucleoside/nucleotide kinase family protein n=1 Tax=Pseudomonas abieticivorans TaxID=2931382 RepID=UPI0020C10851|nr:nucleoside/nucleotide kinase family protein [Pseudomonas sp. PIA16]